MPGVRLHACVVGSGHLVGINQSEDAVAGNTVSRYPKAGGTAAAISRCAE